RGLTGPSSPVAPAPPHVPSPRPEIAPRALTIPAAPAPLPRPPAAPAPLPRPSAAPAPFPRPPAPPALSWWTDTSIRSELGLDTRQVQALERITSDVAPRLLNLLRRFTAKEGELSRLVAAETLDRDAARLQIERLAEALRALRATSRTLEQDLLEVLTPEQRQNLQERSPFRRQETP
ncbi:MAG: periplasmic heavy metal sensor, partial [Thermoanaerobaculia bacterium]|nr:periplasmic heavy metal sensor [Thermoanaerobaculia bacterium]